MDAETVSDLQNVIGDEKGGGPSPPPSQKVSIVETIKAIGIFLYLFIYHTRIQCIMNNQLKGKRRNCNESRFY